MTYMLAILDSNLQKCIFSLLLFESECDINNKGDKQRKDSINMKDIITMKSLTREKINNLTDIQLYNILFGPVIEQNKEIERYTREQMSQTAIAVFGATAAPIKRRMERIAQIVNEKKPALIIFSGGHSWDGINPKTYPQEEIREKWATKKYMHTVENRTQKFIEFFPVLKHYAFEQMEESWNKKQKKTKGSFNENLQQLLDETIDQFLNRIQNNEKSKERVFKQYQEYKDANKDQEHLSFKQWLEGYARDIFAKQYILNQLTEADIMNVVWNEVYNGEKKGIRVALDRTSNDTSENARNCLQILQQAKNRNIKTLAIVNEWPYLLRAVLTTKKLIEENGLNIKLIGIAADRCKNIGIEYEDMEEYRSKSNTGLRAQIIKMTEYQDVADSDVTKYYKMKSIVSGGPTVYINGKEYNIGGLER